MVAVKIAPLFARVRHRRRRRRRRRLQRRRQRGRQRALLLLNTRRVFFLFSLFHHRASCLYVYLSLLFFKVCVRGNGKKTSTTWLLFGRERNSDEKNQKSNRHQKKSRVYVYVIYCERFLQKKKCFVFSSYDSYYSAKATRFLRLLFTANKTERNDSDLPRLAKEARSAIASTHRSRSALVSQAKR